MRVCPGCGTIVVVAPTSSDSVQIKSGGGKVSKKTIDNYICEKCGKRFAVFVGRGELLLFPMKDVRILLARLNSTKSSNESLRERVGSLISEKKALAEALKRAKERVYTRSLQVKAEQLEQQVASLKKEKGRLQELLAGAG